ncbi:glycosyltransferase family 4 protein [Sulfitobacter sp. D35]|uniref:glycosyltransferase family 4 protein n=1 Tax=Sulfitobacter sp. D35 TaxID=3083252 RepID=UPI00296ED45F|nr:glycosyltransferase family 4 protein [Sulfitobacter sp. D35]MDW4499708.1 glycosyltransferase family 4 protein [Sulfitobacter sp. D35]
MSRIAFYAPLKPPSHPRPSGDRAMARALMLALEHTGRHVTVASTLRSYDGAGDSARQQDLEGAAQADLGRLVESGRKAGWTCWLTYHCYYKAPDLLGPAVTRQLGIPYVQIEATRARKRLDGPWARFAALSEAACDHADLIFYLTERDGETLIARAPEGQTVRRLHAFLPHTDLPPPSTLDGPMLSVGMFRPGDKLGSYRIIAETLALLQTSDWCLDIAGDGAARPQVEELIRGFGPRVRLLGECDQARLAEAYASASLLFWPGVNEAFGMAYLEAQARGLPVVAQDRPGVRDVLAGTDQPPPAAGTSALAERIDRLLGDPALRRARSREVRAHVQSRHLLGTAARTLDDGLREVAA